jgi:hypothetical protein
LSDRKKNTFKEHPPAIGNLPPLELRPFRRRYTIAEDKEALDLKNSNSETFRRLPQVRRESAEEYASWLESLAARAESDVKLMCEALVRIPAKTRDLVKREPSIGKKYSIPELYSIPPEILAHLRIPKKRGRKRAKETRLLLKKIVEFKARGMDDANIARRIYRNVDPKLAKDRIDKMCERYQAWIAEHVAIRRKGEFARTKTH